METQIEQEFQPYLLDNEKIIWTGKPDIGKKYRPFDIILIPFTIVWCVFLLFTGSIYIFSFIGLPLASIGIYILFGRFEHDATIRKRQSYCLTNTRSIIKQGSEIMSFPLSIQSKLTLVGNHSIFFEPLDLNENTSFTPNKFAYYTPSISMDSFQYIDDAQIVYNQILVAQIAANNNLLKVKNDNAN